MRSGAALVSPDVVLKGMAHTVASFLHTAMHEQGGWSALSRGSSCAREEHGRARCVPVADRRELVREVATPGIRPVGATRRRARSLSCGPALVHRAAGKQSSSRGVQVRLLTHRSRSRWSCQYRGAQPDRGDACDARSTATVWSARQGRRWSSRHAPAKACLHA